MNNHYQAGIMTQVNMDCIPQESVIENVKLATAYVPNQKYCGVMSPMDSLKYGTAFKELVSIYHKNNANTTPGMRR